MTTTRDIRELIAEQAATPAERKALEGVAGRLDDALSQDVPHRPEFKAELRRKLMAQARRQAPPSLLRRPAVWGSAMAMAAAVGILAVGLTLWNDPKVAPDGKTPIVNPKPNEAVDPNITHVAGFPNLPRNAVPDEQLPAGHPGAESLAGLDLKKGIVVYRLEGRPDQNQFAKMAAGLRLTAPTESGADGWAVNQGDRSLRLSTDGHVMYVDNNPDSAGARTINSGEVVAVARQFLLEASLTFSGDPLVLASTSGRPLYRVTYTRRVDNRPVMNLPTVVTVSDRGTVVSADAYILFDLQDKGRAVEVYTPEQARQQAQERGNFAASGVDLVYVRTQSKEGDWWLQPYWRVFGASIVRYVPALK